MPVGGYPYGGAGWGPVKMVTMQTWVQSLTPGTRAFAGVLRDGDLAAPVPPCPGWTLADLADHLGGIYQWAAHAISEGTPDAQLKSAPSGRADLVEWYLGHADRLIQLLQTTPADAPAWGFGPKPRTVAFWARRQTHETDMHLWDAKASQGEAHAIPAGRALDGLDEVLTVFFPRQVRLNRIQRLAQTVELDPGLGARRRFVLFGDGVGAPPEQVAATVHGPAVSLLLLVWKRIGLDDATLRISGDSLAAAAVLGQRLTP